MAEEKPLNSGVELYRSFLKSEKKSLSDMEGLVSLYSAELIRFIAGIVGEPDVAYDLMIDSFVKLGLSGARFSDEAALKAYLFTTGKNLAFNRLKYIAREKKTLRPIDDFLKAAVSGNSPEDDLLGEERDTQLYKAMDKLKREYREALRLLYFEGVSFSDAGLIMNKSDKQLYNLVYNAKTSLKKILEKGGFRYGNE